MDSPILHRVQPPCLTSLLAKVLVAADQFYDHHVPGAGVPIDFTGDGRAFGAAAHGAERRVSRLYGDRGCRAGG